MTKLFALFRLTFFFAKEVLVSNFVVARDALRPKPNINPRIFPIKLGPLTDRQVFVLTNMVTMTPGTLSLDLSDDRRILNVHTLYGDQALTLQDSIQNSYEPLIRKAI